MKIAFLMDGEPLSKSGKEFLSEQQSGNTANAIQFGNLAVILSSEEEEEERITDLKSFCKYVVVIKCKLFRNDPLHLRQEILFSLTKFVHFHKKGLS